MNWLYPIWFWGLIGIPLYFFFCLYSLTYPERTVASLLLWKEVETIHSSETARSPSLHHWITALFLSILLSTLIANRAGPYSWVTSREAKLHFMLDVSASMKTKNNQGKSRYERALDRLEQYAQRLPDESIWTITIRTPQPERMMGTPKDLLSTLRERSATDVSIPMHPDALFDTTKPSNNQNLFLITDDPGEKISSHEDMSVLSIGSPGPNSGILSAYGHRTENTLILFVKAVFHGTGSTKGSLSIQDTPEQPPVQTSVQLKQGIPKTFQLTMENVDSTSTGMIQLKTNRPDSLDTDNQFYFANRTPYRLRVRIQGKDKLIEQIINTIGMNDISLVDHRPQVNFYYSPSARVSEDLWLDKENRTSIVVHPALSRQIAPEMTEPVQLSNLNTPDHPITNELDLTGVTFRNTRVLSKLSRNMSPLITSEKGALSIIEHTEEKTIWFFGDPFSGFHNRPDTNWSVSARHIPSFVMYWQNVFQYLNPWRIETHGDLVYWHTGQSPLKNKQNTDLNLSQAGLENVNSDSITGPVPKNLISERETNTMRVPDSSDWKQKLPNPETVREKSVHVQTVTVGVFVLFMMFLLVLSLRGPKQSL